ncbi:MAG: hypothetical protein JO026_04070, partial [Patescibacteria group bacterium]|nr:hypothetical protein [Patescibacteria group bacterium]
DSFTETRLSNTTLPGMEELYAIASSTILLRTLNDAKNVLNYVGTIHASSSEETLDIAPTRTFDSVTVTPSGALFTVAKTSSGSVAEISSKGGGRVATVFASPISSWVPLAGGTRLFVQSAPSAFAPGYLYEIKNAGAGATLSKVAQGRSGFVALPSPSGRYIATSQNLDTGFAFFVLDTKSGTWWSAPIHGSAYSCAWIENAEPLIFCAVPKDPPHGNYPDDWLMGNISFSDDAWILNPPLNTAYYIGSLYDSSGTIDAEHVAVDQTGSYALFTNKKDLSLWSLYIRDAVIRAAGE